MELLQVIVTLLLVMDPLGNVPLFLSVLRTVDPARRRKVLLREIAFAYIVLAAFLLVGDHLMRFVGLEQPAVSIAGGIVLFLIALRMVFPSDSGMRNPQLEGEPFLVPLAVPLIAGPSALATLLLLQSASHGATASLLVALTIAWAITAVILMSSTVLYRVLHERGLLAMERLMGMLLVMVAVQMLLNGVRVFLADSTP
jgi:multiple antibiotic resistance protein